MANDNNKAPEPTSSASDLLRTLAKRLFNPYRPELHYMRGPGPKWHEQHPDTVATASTTVIFGPDPR